MWREPGTSPPVPRGGTQRRAPRPALGARRRRRWLPDGAL